MYSNQLLKLMNDVKATLKADGISIDEESRNEAYKALDACIMPTRCRLGFELLLSLKTKKGLPIFRVPFKGSISTTIQPIHDGTFSVMWSSLNLDDYLSHHKGTKYRVCTWQQLDELYSEFETGMETDPKGISEGDFYQYLNVLPPAKHQHLNGYELFHISEAMYGTIHLWVAMDHETGTAFSWSGSSLSTKEQLAKKLEIGTKLSKIATVRRAVGV